MPGIARKILICAAVDGLVVHPLTSKRESYASPSYKIKYGDASISPSSRDALPDLTKPNSSFEAFGIVGLITVSSFSYLISITRRQQVAQIRGNPIYVITEVALTPCSSYQDANSAISDTATALRLKQEKDSEATEAEDDSDNISISGSLETLPDAVPGPDDEVPETRPSLSSRNSVAEDVISRRGSYGQFAQKWFSRSGWTMAQKRNMGLTSAEKAEQSKEKDDQKPELQSAAEQVQPVPEGNTDDQSPAEDTSKSAVAAAKVAADQDPKIPAAGGLLPKLLRTTQILFGSSHSYYFSYDHDITRSCANPRVPEVPLFPMHNHVDPQYFWNRNVIRPFIEAGADAIALPLMQGFIGQRTFTVDSHPPQVDDAGAKNSVEMSTISPTEEKPEGALIPSQKQYDLTVISRRSVKRAGLRYCRRGVDEEGYPANNVETEQILSPSVLDENSKVYSFVQIRGSIPLFFTQSPYSLKPTPVMQHSPEANFQALKKHFDRLGKQYGGVQIVNLVEKHGTEGKIGDAYESSVKKLNDEAKGENKEGDDKVAWEWFDFHDACRGMKFENVSLLLQTLGKKLEAFGSTVVEDEKVTTTQAGVLRVNCMDCLDRTNVVESSFAKYMLEQQLKEQGFDLNAQADQEMAWFNTLWADNGDAISKQYASTAAMKGDYTRTRKRNYRGALTDAGLSLTRFYNGMVNDFFVQATIDFLLGNVTSHVFEEFEATMMTKDPAVSMSKMREQAIELSQKRVIENEDEEFIGGWTMLTPRAADTIKPQQTMEEAVLLLTDKAVYLCRFDWNMDKVSSFERVDLSHIEKIKFGTYITSAFAAAQTDEEKNVGLVIQYRPGRTDVQRVNTRSISSSLSSSIARSRGKSTSSTDESVAQTENQTGSTGIVDNLFGRRTQAPVEVPSKKIVLKALYTTTSFADPALRDPGGVGEGEGITKLTEIQQVVSVAAEIERLAILAQPGRFLGQAEGQKTLVEKEDIVSLADARASTSFLETIGHSIKKLVWA